MRSSEAQPKCIFGTMTFGKQVDEATADRMLGMFLDAGHNELDTAYVYGEGVTEKILGRILTPERWQQIYLATKANPWEEGGLQPASVRLQLETSLQRLKTESVDLFYLHSPDLKTPIETTLETCQKLFSEGKFRALGLSNYAAWQVVDIWHICQRNGWVLPTVYQGMYNAITRDVETELFPALRAMGIKFYAYNPLAGGMLTGKHLTSEQLPAAGRFVIQKNYQERYWKKSFFDAVDHLRHLCSTQKDSMADCALRWQLFHSRLSAEQGDAIIIGASGPEQLRCNLESLSRPPLGAEIVTAYDHAWDLARPDCPAYFRT
ncbi:MAG: aldo/keto reductase [Deltaproteobacteria bacterium]|jgi:aflatoxin B1 aldehyde reductase|nr:aldo/keto reductase [Deltaproteobacteria bacterium]MCW9049076.1 aldo/keto reductase [Deltaproteobacteria bacterium]